MEVSGSNEEKQGFLPFPTSNQPLAGALEFPPSFLWNTIGKPLDQSLVSLPPLVKLPAPEFLSNLLPKLQGFLLLLG